MSRYVKELAMISDLFAIVVWWNAVQNYPGLIDALGYFYGIVAASFALEALETYIQQKPRSGG